jgi:hypothetical protein
MRAFARRAAGSKTVWGSLAVIVLFAVSACSTTPDRAVSDKQLRKLGESGQAVRARERAEQRLEHETANRSAYEDANRTLLRRADRLVAVWNGEPPSGKGGGTADTVLEARDAGLSVDVVWPDGAARRS